MKIIHTSDWHIGQILHGYDRGDEFRQFVRQLCDIVRRERPDALLVCGDVFDTQQPSAAAARLYHNALLALRDACPAMTVVVTAGNHDSPSRLEMTAGVLRRLDVTVVGDVARDDEGLIDLPRHLVPVRDTTGLVAGYVAAVPHLRGMDYRLTGGQQPGGQHPQLHFVKRLLDHAAEVAGDRPVVLMMHTAVRGDSAAAVEERIGNIDYLALSDIAGKRDYLALGHIHRAHTLPGSGGGARYCGAPLAMAFDEQHDHSVTVVTLNGHDHPVIATEVITTDMPLLTLPAEAQPLERALEILAAQPDDRRGYVRVNLATDGYLPSSAREQIVRQLKDKRLRFCDIITTAAPQARSASGSGVTLEQFRRLTPEQVAGKYFANKGITIAPAVAALLRQAIGDHQQPHSNEP